MSDTERRYGIADRAAGEAARVIGRGQPLRGGTDTLLLSRIGRAVVDALDADDRREIDRLSDIISRASRLAEQECAWMVQQVLSELRGANVALDAAGEQEVP